MSGPHRFAVLAAATLLVLATVSGPTMWRAPDDAAITGPYAALLAASTDLGPSRAADAQLTVTLSGRLRPAR
jgi:kumamolisin